MTVALSPQLLEFSRQLGLPSPYLVCLNYLPVPYRSSADGGWRVPLPPNRRLSQGIAVVSTEVDLARLRSDDPRAYGEFLRSVPELEAALGDMPVWLNRGPGEAIPAAGQVPGWRPDDPGYAVFHPLLEGMCREWARWVTIALAWFWAGEAAPEIPVFPGTEGLSDDRVREIMVAAQREVDRETNRRGQVVGGPFGSRDYGLRLTDLPWERQRRLAEARRFVLYRYGITAGVWRANRWSLWEVPDHE
jgi:hypothetical protein